MTQNKNPRPLKDKKVEEEAREPSNLIPKSLLKGNTVGEAHQKSQRAMLKNFRFMISSSASEDQRDAAPYLWANIDSQVIIGDSKATA